MGFRNLKNDLKIKNKIKKSFAFTLVEIMVTLSVIGILTAIILPIAFNSAPDENVMKFKKGHNILYTAIKDLVNSDKYYMNGDLGVKANGDLVNTATYFCETFSDVITTKEVSCKTTQASDVNYSHINMSWIDAGTYTLEEVKGLIDKFCKYTAVEVGKEIITTDNIAYYSASPAHHFRTVYKNPATQCLESGANCYFYQKNFESVFDASGNIIGTRYVGDFIDVYKVFCMDVDGIPNNATKDNCVNECPFGYAVRVDGKIQNGARVEEWLNKNLQK